MTDYIDDEDEEDDEESGRSVPNGPFGQLLNQINLDTPLGQILNRINDFKAQIQIQINVLGRWTGFSIFECRIK